MSGFSCSGCGASIRIEGLETSFAERKVYCTRCGHVTVI
ncbi:MAG: MJ0042-type zinc finger domain-containing protein [Candidatus Thermoplasmatota archaeon]|nr:MJ0042-type zinc finger domain-containing protein [Candidatus Thermoplasmatota archaeon]